MSVQISVIVPVYNAQDYLCRCIDSIINQIYTDLEVVLVDDGSKDNSAQICKEYERKDHRVHFFHTENYGVTHARQIGIQKSKGTYVCFVDSDDYILPSYLLNLYNAIIKTNADISYAANSEGEVDNCQYIKSLLRNTCDWGLPYKLYRKRLFNHDTLDISPSINVGEDLVANLRLCKNPLKIILIHCDGYVYFKNPESVTHTRNLSLEYEELFMCAVEESLVNRTELYKEDLWFFKLRCWKNLVLHGIKVDRNKEWVKWILDNVPSSNNVTIGDKVLIYISNFYVVFFALKILYLIKSVMLNVKNS